MERYFYSDQHKLYRTTDTNFSDGTATVRLQRYSWIFKNWNGHIHNHEETRNKIKNRDGIEEITEEEANHIINNLNRDILSPSYMTKYELKND